MSTILKAKKIKLQETHADTISQYLSSLRSHSLFTAEDEQEKAAQMFKAEEKCWALILNSERALFLLEELLLESDDAEALLKVLRVDFENSPKVLEASIKTVMAGDSDRKLLLSFVEVLRAATAFKEKREILKEHRQAMHYRNDFIQANLRLVVNIARKFHHHKMPLIDLIQEGNLGLIKGVYRFDASKGFRFSTYAHWWIRQAIERAIMNKACEIRVPVHIYDARREMAKSEKYLFTKLERQALIEEVAEHMGVSIEKVHYLKAMGPNTPKSLDEKMGDSDHRTLAESIEDIDQMIPEEQAIINDQNTQVQSIFKYLSIMERDIIERRFGMAEKCGETLEQIGKSYNLSRERVRQIQAQGLKKMQKHCLQRRIAI